MSKHTPGPWKMLDDHPSHACLHIRREGDKQTWGIYCGPEVASVYTSNDNADADARLIAAAPDLLEALTNLLVAEKLDDGDPILGSARSAAAIAIAKATGAA